VAVRYQVIGPDGETGPAEPARTRNIGVGGAFVESADPHPVGTRLRLSIDLPPSGRTVMVSGEVRWLCDGDTDPVHGMGVRFTGLSVEDLVALNEYFAALPAIADHDAL
jgi:uncharacterized protein (TIGR02266 family)